MTAASVEAVVLPCKSAPSGQHFIKQGAEAEDIGAGVELGGPEPARETCMAAVPAIA